MLTGNMVKMRVHLGSFFAGLRVRFLPPHQGSGYRGFSERSNVIAAWDETLRKDAKQTRRGEVCGESRSFLGDSEILKGKAASLMFVLRIREMRDIVKCDNLPFSLPST